MTALGALDISETGPYAVAAIVVLVFLNAMWTDRREIARDIYDGLTLLLSIAIVVVPIWALFALGIIKW